MRLIAVICSALVSVGCAGNARRISEPLRVSQKGTNAHLIQRVEAEAQSACSHDDGLRGVTWAYSDLPDGGALPDWEPADPFALARHTKDEQAASKMMQQLAQSAPKPYQFEYRESDLMDESYPAIYTCNDGVQVESVAFTFVPYRELICSPGFMSYIAKRTFAFREQWAPKPFVSLTRNTELQD